MFNYVKMIVDLYVPQAEETEELEGQGMVEYGLILALVSVVAIAVLLIVGENLDAVFQFVADALSI
jgi:pilus assembly protein Flp/PilA